MRRLLRFRARLMAIARARAAGMRPGVSIAPGVRFGRGVACRTDGGRITIGEGVEIGSGTGLSAGPSGHLEIGRDVFISGGCIVAADGHVSIGDASMLGELVSVRDHDHDIRFPPREGRNVQADVVIGARVWIGAKSSVVRGASIGDDAVIGAHALVNRPVEADSLAVGVPARMVRRGIRERGDAR